MIVTLQNLAPYQRQMPEPFQQMRLGAGASGKIPWSLDAFEFLRYLDKQIERGELEVSFEPDRLEKYLRGYFKSLVSTDGILEASGRTYRAQYPTIQSAIDAVASEAGPTNRFVITLPPEDFNENVVLEEFIYLRGSSFGVEKATRLISGSGITLTMPSRNCGVEQVFVGTESVNPADAALRCRKSTNPRWNEAFVKDILISTEGGSRGVWIDQIGSPVPNEEDNLVMIYAGLDGTDLGVGAYVDGGASGNGGFIWYLGGGGAPAGAASGPLYGIHLVNGGFCITQSIGMSADSTDPTAYGIYNQGGFFVALSGVTVDGFNLHRSGPGTTNVFREYTSFGGPAAGTPARLEAGSFNLVSKVELDGLGNPWGHGGTGWQVDPAAAIMPISPTMMTSTGTIPVGGAPDQRPSAVGIRPMGVITFYATNGNRGGPGVPGTGCMLEWNPGLQQWEDSTGAVHP